MLLYSIIISITGIYRNAREVVDIDNQSRCSVVCGHFGASNDFCPSIIVLISTPTAMLSSIWQQNHSSFGLRKKESTSNRPHLVNILLL